MAWTQIHQQVANKLAELAEKAPTTLWQNVFAEAQKRWLQRQDIREGKVNAEVTIKVNVPSDEVAAKALERIRQFAQNFGEIGDENLRVVMLGQKYQRNGQYSVLLRIRIVASVTKQRSKFVASADEI